MLHHCHRCFSWSVIKMRIVQKIQLMKRTSFRYTFVVTGDLMAYTYSEYTSYSCFALLSTTTFSPFFYLSLNKVVKLQRARRASIPWPAVPKTAAISWLRYGPNLTVHSSRLALYQWNWYCTILSTDSLLLLRTWYRKLHVSLFN